MSKSKPKLTTVCLICGMPAACIDTHKDLSECLDAVCASHERLLKACKELMSYTFARGSTIYQLEVRKRARAAIVAATTNAE